ncbi:hypothetical protein AgCh_024177 [Apium graveolens]
MVLGPRNGINGFMVPMSRRFCYLRNGQFPVPPVLSSSECVVFDQLWSVSCCRKLEISVTSTPDPGVEVVTGWYQSYRRMPPKKNIPSNSSNRDSDGGPVMNELLDLLRQQSNQMAQQQEQFQQQQ